ncbi:MAG: hypothetical protein B6D71_00920 [gamma proteobacterium symbiont of Stewartia floridana]|nr:MAG: hypothetical protein B6D71_00920 [gamma proteobacterium symbiont of Stewartia floridana]
MPQGGRQMKFALLTVTVLLSSCSESVDVELFNYQACRKDMTEEYISQGIDPVAANMKSKAYCKEQQAARQ